LRTIPFLKVHGSENEFLLIDEKRLDKPLQELRKADLAKLLCSRESGIGADGILFVTIFDEKESVDGRMEIFNADGSKASMCGNGLRVAGRYIMEKLRKNKVVVRTEMADLQVSLNPINGSSIPFYQVEISPVSFSPKSLPMNIELNEVIQQPLPFLSDDYQFSALSVPNPHLIARVSAKQMNRQELERIGHMVNSPNHWFPDGVNISFIYFVKEGEMIIQTFERGVGITNACGTAMAAASVVSCKCGWHTYNEPMTMYNNGGFCITIPQMEENRIWVDLIGNATFLFFGEVNVSSDFNKLVNWSILKEYEQEEKEYVKIKREAKDKIFQTFGRTEL